MEENNLSQINDKAVQWQEWLDKKEIKCFDAESLGDEVQTVLFRTNLDVNSQKLPMVLQTDTTLCLMLQVLVISSSIKENNLTAVLNRANELNQRYKIFKYILFEDRLELHCCIFGKDEDFDPQTVNIAIDSILEHLIEEYPEWMKLIWAD